MRVLVTGSGGREHALAWKLAQSGRISEVLVAPGNAGTAREPGVRNVPLEADENARLVAFAITEDLELVIPGPEAPLVAGLVDQMERAGMPCFGPRRKRPGWRVRRSFPRRCWTPPARLPPLSRIHRA